MQKIQWQLDSRLWLLAAGSPVCFLLMLLPRRVPELSKGNLSVWLSQHLIPLNLENISVNVAASLHVTIRSFIWCTTMLSAKPQVEVTTQHQGGVDFLWEPQLFYTRLLYYSPILSYPTFQANAVAMQPQEASVTAPSPLYNAAHNLLA